MDTDNMRTAVTDGAIYNNTRLHEEFFEPELADRNESKCFKNDQIFYVFPFFIHALD